MQKGKILQLLLWPAEEKNDLLGTKNKIIKKTFLLLQPIMEYIQAICNLHTS